LLELLNQVLLFELVSRAVFDRGFGGGSDLFNAAAAMMSNAGCTSVGDWLITLRISLVAFCCSSAAFVSVNRRTFSIAITACSAKVCSNST
jgi:hypothetical protein